MTMTLAGSVVVAMAALGAGCTHDPVRQQAEAAMSRTTPAGADRPFLSALTRNGMSVEYRWTLSVATGWPTYAKWAADQLSPMFTCRESALAVECVRTATGDTFSVRLSLANPDAPHDVSGVFTARPN